MNVGFIIQARTKSSRFPRKIIVPFYNKQTILDIILSNLKLRFPHIQIVLATTKDKSDDILAEYADKWDVHFFQGEESDVLLRFIHAAKKFHLDGIIRICSDNPFLDMDYMDILFDNICQNYDYISFRVNNKPAIKTHYGFWSEFIRLDALININDKTNDNIYHEHVTNYIYENPSFYRIKWIDIPNSLTNLELRFTVDTKDDFIIQQKIYNALQGQSSKLSVESILQFVSSRQDYILTMQKLINQNTK